MLVFVLVVFGQGLGQVLLGLVVDFWYLVIGVGVFVVGDVVVFLVGVGQDMVIVEVVGGCGRCWCGGRCWGGCGRSGSGLCGGFKGQEDGQSEISGEWLWVYGVVFGDLGLVVLVWGME